ncbi:MAG: TIGR00730 family Rossman fold protein [Alphaproteobacteria bacterium]
MNKIKSVCVYCGSSSRVAESYKDAARALGKILADNDIELVYGGGQVGIMGILADAVLAAGGRVTGIIPEFLFAKEVGKGDVSNLIRVGSMHERKQKMAEVSDAFVVLPGGFGTMDETFEILTWRQLALHNKPTVIVDIDGYWRPLVSLMEHIIDEGFASPDNRGLYDVVATVDDVLPAISDDVEAISPVESKWM